MASNTASITDICSKNNQLLKRASESERKLGTIDDLSKALKQLEITGARPNAVLVAEQTETVVHAPDNSRRATVAKDVTSSPTTGGATTAVQPPIYGSSQQDSQPMSKASPASPAKQCASPKPITSHFPRDECKGVANLRAGPLKSPEKRKFETPLHYRVRRYYVGNIDAECTELSLLAHLRSVGVKPTFIRLMPNSKDDSVQGAQLNVHPSDSDSVEAKGFWPSRIYIRQWHAKFEQPRLTYRKTQSY